MLKKINFYIYLMIALSITGCNDMTVQMSENVCKDISGPRVFTLADYACYSASVFPTITEDGELYAIISREAEGRKNKLGKFHKYDDFSGSKDEGETHPVQTAGHEFLEEANLEHTLGWTLSQTEAYIKPENGNTWSVIAYSKDKDECDPRSKLIRNVTYLTSFDKHKDRLFITFYKERAKEMERYDKANARRSERTTVEKDRLAKVKWSDLKTAIIGQVDSNQIVKVIALVMDPKTNRFRKQMIQLRPFLVIKLRPYFLGDPYDQGEHETIRHYQG